MCLIIKKEIYQKIFSEKKEEYSKSYQCFLDDYVTEKSMIRTQGKESKTI